MAPAGFKTTYMGTDDFACNTTAVRPLRYAQTLHQAAKQQVRVHASPSICTASTSHNHSAYTHIFASPELHHDPGWLSI